jgi:acyl-CoA thioesterase-1
LLFISCSSEAKETEELNKNKVIVALWDSLTAWYWVWETENYPYKLKKILSENDYNYEIVNWWISWDTSFDLKKRASEYLLEDPEIVIIAIWANDWLRWKPVEDMKSNILEIIDMFLENKTKVVISWMDTPITHGLWYRSDFKNAYKEIEKQRSEIYFHKYFLKWVALKPEYNIHDNIHPNSDWYDIIAWEIYDFLRDEKILKK